MDTLLAVLLALSFAGNLALFLLLRHKKKTKKPTLDQTAGDLLHDLTRRGQAILRVEVIDPANLLLRSPRS